jgi:hypothetical protein
MADRLAESEKTMEVGNLLAVADYLVLMHLGPPLEQQAQLSPPWKATRIFLNTSCGSQFLLTTSGLRCFAVFSQQQAEYHDVPCRFYHG